MVLVTRNGFASCLARLYAVKKAALDTETTGLRPYHGDRLFSIAAAFMDRGAPESLYFNFYPYEGLDPELVLTPEHLAKFRPLLAETDRLWFMHNAKFDLAMLSCDGLPVGGVIHCTQAQELVVRNDYTDYSLEACAGRIGHKKDDAVENYITEHGLWEWETIPGRKTRKKRKFFYKVPFDIMSKYASQDAIVTLQLGLHQEAALQRIANDTLKNPDTAKLPTVLAVHRNEKRLTHTVSRMEQTGLRIDRDYCLRAASHELARAENAVASFKRETGRDYIASSKLFAEVLAGDKELWEYTEKGNPSFEYDVIKYFKSPAAKLILELRDAKSKSDFYQGFVYHSDSQGFVHPNLDPDGTATGRFSSSNPNFQNLTSEEVLFCKACKTGHEDWVEACEKCGSKDLEEPEFLIRRAIVPRPGKIFFMPDYEQMEYKLMLELACRMLGKASPLATRVRGGEDFHQAVTDMVKEMIHKMFKRKQIKNVNFAKIYGAGLGKLAKMLDCTKAEAKVIVDAINSVAPEIDSFCDKVIETAVRRKFIFNWFGRRCYFPYSDFSYKAPNYLIQGGCADVVKISMNGVADLLQGTKSQMLLQVHDELVVEIDESEAHTLPKKIQEIMLAAFPAKFLPLTSSAEWSAKSMADKVKGYPV